VTAPGVPRLSPGEQDLLAVRRPLQRPVERLYPGDVEPPGLSRACREEHELRWRVQQREHPFPIRRERTPVAVAEVHRGGAIRLAQVGGIVRPRTDEIREQDGLSVGREVELRSEEHTSESSHDQISYAVFCLKK